MFTFPFTLHSSDEEFVNEYFTRFNGTNEYIQIPDSTDFDLSTNVSVFLWIKTTSTASEDWIISKFNYPSNQRSFAFGIQGSRSRVLISDDGAGTNTKDYRSGTFITGSTWKMIGFTFSANDLKIYLNGVEDTVIKSTDNTVNSINVSTADVFIGSLLSGEGFIDADIDEIGIWNTTLSASEILEIYNSGTPLDIRRNKGNYSSASSLKAFYRMGDGDNATTLFDNKNSNNGTLNNMSDANYISVAPLDNSYSSSFNGVDEYIDCGDDVSFNQASISISFWAKFTAGNMNILGKSPDIRIENHSNDTVRFFVRGELPTGGTKEFRFANGVFNTGNWHHIVMTYEDSTDTLTIYKDGAEQTPATQVNPTLTGLRFSAIPFVIGDAALANPFNGNIDEVSFWSKALSLTEIGDIYNFGVPNDLNQHTASANLISWWRMGDGDNATTIFDNAGSNDGALVNMDASNYVLDVP
jgi:hypothetical protein